MRKTRTPVDQFEWLFRRSYSSPEHKFMYPDGTPTSRVFKLRAKDNGELSVDVKSLTDPAAAIGDPTRFMLFEVENKIVLDLGLNSLYDPLNLEEHGIDNPSHAIITGMVEDDEILPGLLAKNATRVII